MSPPYTVVLNDTMVSSSGSQLEIDGNWNLSSTVPMWSVVFLSNTSFNFFVYYANGSTADEGFSLPCINGGVQVVVTSTQITFTGTTLTNENLTPENPENLLQIASFANGGNFTSGKLDITLTTL
jgi:hypothetical protein